MACSANCTIEEHLELGKKYIGNNPSKKILAWYMGMRDGQSTIDEHMSWKDEETGLTVELRLKEQYPAKPNLEHLP